MKAMTERDERAIRRIIERCKAKYLASPTYFEAEWDIRLFELSEKAIHADWWNELTGAVDEESLCWQTYYHAIEGDCYVLLEERPEPEAFMHYIHTLLEDYRIPDAEMLGDMSEECKSAIRVDSQHFSRCSIGKGKWFWVTWASFEDICERTIHSSGVAMTSVEAEEQAKASLLSDFGCRRPIQESARSAGKAHRYQAAKRRAAKTSNATNTHLPEWVYRHYIGDYDGSWGNTPHRVVKKTAKRVYVEIDRDQWSEQGQVYHDVTTITLDRQELENTGRAWSRTRRDYFYTTPYRQRPPRPQCFELLRLEFGCDEEAIRTAYRTQAKKLHPDHGGNAQDFKRLHAAYEQALGTLKGRA